MRGSSEPDHHRQRHFLAVRHSSGAILCQSGGLGADVGQSFRRSEHAGGNPPRAKSRAERAFDRLPSGESSRSRRRGARARVVVGADTSSRPSCRSDRRFYRQRLVAGLDFVCRVRAHHRGSARFIGIRLRPIASDRSDRRTDQRGHPEIRSRAPASGDRADLRSLCQRIGRYDWPAHPVALNPAPARLRASQANGTLLFRQSMSRKSGIRFSEKDMR